MQGEKQLCQNAVITFEKEKIIDGKVAIKKAGLQMVLYFTLLCMERHIVRSEKKLSALAKESAKVSAPLGKEKTFGDVLNLWMTNNRIRLKGGTINKYQSLLFRTLSSTQRYSVCE